ncbi:ABC transporter permease subunit [Beduinella massiliensis]|uniref:ABC transporter permease subunit n=1 Tax=Beduinella massiliensis TaxID=1852363 RepID=UPI000C823E6F
MSKKKFYHVAGYALLYALLIAFGFVAVLPFLWMVRSSFMGIKQIFIMPPEWIPNPFTLQNFVDVFTKTDIPKYFGNTVFVVLMNLLGVLLTSSMAAYAFSRVRWKGRDAIFTLLLSAMMLPSAVTLIPVYIGWSRLGMVDSYAPLIIPAFLGGGAYNIFLMRQFFLTIPRELDEAAFVDGASRFRIYWNIDIPLAKSSMIVVGLFCFMATWNDFFNPLIYLNTMSKYTVAVGLQSLMGKYTSKWNLVMTASVVVTMPCVLVFLFGQKHIMGGIALTGIKG